MRLPGSIHRKDPDRPRLCRIVEHNPDAEIALEDALAELEGLAALRGMESDEPPRAGGARPAEGGPEAAFRSAGHGFPPVTGKLLLDCAERIPNDNREWADWTKHGLAFWRASGGS